MGREKKGQEQTGQEHAELQRAYRNLYGFELEAEESIEEWQSEARIYRHKSTGAKLLQLACHDKNKVFGVLFNTQANNDSGVAHIIEHSVFNGSENYPLREPFAVLEKNSLNSFMNAMTFADRTFYPVASYHKKDFLTCVEVYLDAVFHPLCLKNEAIFRQEGLRLEVNDDGEPQFNGVVYNEMKGVLSDPAVLLWRESSKLLYDNNYRWNSGGDPKAIRELSYEDFKAFYHKFYDPGNACFLVYGDIDLKKVAERIDKSLQSNKKSLPLPPVPPVPLASPLHSPLRGSVPASSSDGKSMALLQFVGTHEPDLDDEDSLEVASLALFSLESSPLRRALIESDFCEDVSEGPSQSQRDLASTVLLSGTRESNPEKVSKVFFKALADFLKESPEKRRELFLAAYSLLSFQLREADSGSLPRGLLLSLSPMLAWPDGVSPFAHLHYEERLKRLKAKIESGKMEAWISEFFLHNPFHAVITQIPVDPESFAAAAAQEEKAAAAARWEELGKSGQEREIKANRAMKTWQESEDKPEILARIPLLQLSDLARENAFREASAEKILYPGDPDHNSFQLLHYNIFTSGILYLNFSFPLENLSPQDLFHLGILKEVLGRVDTRSHSYAELTNQLFLKSGGLSCGLDFYPTASFLSFSLKVLPENLEAALNLLEEILLFSRLDSRERIAQILQKELLDRRLDLISCGHSAAMQVVASHYDPLVLADSQSDGLSFYENLRQYLQNADQNKQLPDFSEALQELLDRVLCKDRVQVDFIGEEKAKPALITALQNILSRFPLAAANHPNEEAPSAKRSSDGNPAYIIPGHVQYAALGGRFDSQSSEEAFDGCWHLVRNLLQKDYLWTRLRVEGGAYGGGCQISRRGGLLFYSYRDPHCRESLETFRMAAEWLRHVHLSSEELRGLIIGTIADFDRPCSPALEGNLAIARHYKGLSLAQLQREREAVLSCNLQKIRSKAEILDKVLQQNHFAVFGSEKVIKENAELFSEVKNLF